MFFLILLILSGQVNETISKTSKMKNLFYTFRNCCSNFEDMTVYANYFEKVLELSRK